ncbi:hypothetical protein BJ684DRAFT_4152, partial [Piptocephalis cylindrospora]
MRESNYCSVQHSRAALTLSPNHYDRRALDVTADLPLLNTLTHLSALTSSSSAVREVLTTDGGLERLIRLLDQTPRMNPKDRTTAWRWTLAWHSVVNVGIRGTERVRFRVEQAGGIRLAVTVLDGYL